MNLANKIKKLYLSFEDLFMKNHSCVSCGIEIPDGKEIALCDDCLKNLEKIEGNLCSKCGDEIHYENLKFCEHCKDFEYKFDKNNSCFYYNGTAESMVKNLKYIGDKFISKEIAKLMSKRTDFFEDIDVITFVPINKKRLRERGFNQSEEIAKHLGEILNIPVVSVLEKDKNARHQAGLSQVERLKNLKGSFKLSSGADEIVRGKRVLIVDDVFTTGTTLSECAGALAETRAEAINTLTFAKTKFLR